MAFVKKHIVWLLLGLALVAEAVFLVLLFGRQSEASAKKKNLEAKREELRKLEAKQPGDPAVLAVLGQRKRDITRERGQALLVYGDRSQALGTLFADARDPEAPKDSKPVTLPERDVVRPWLDPLRMDVFLDTYQRLYNCYVKMLEPELVAAGTDRNKVWFAAATGFTGRPGVAIGDIYLEQKRFWIIREVVECAAKAKVASLDIGEIKRVEIAGTGAEKKAQAETARLSDTFGFRVAVTCPYVRLAAFLADLLKSPRLSLRIENLEDFKVLEPAEVEKGRKEAIEARERREAKGTKEAKGGPLTGAEATAAKAAPPTAVAKDEYLVRVILDCRATDFNVAVRQVRFTGPKFSGKNEAKLKSAVLNWIDGETKPRGEKELKDEKAQADLWARKVREAIDSALADIAKETDKEKAKAITIALNDYFTFRLDGGKPADLGRKSPDGKLTPEAEKAAGKGILYDFGQSDDIAKGWIAHYTAFDGLISQARKNLLGRIRQAVEAGNKGDAKVEFKDGLVVVTLCPDKVPEKGLDRKEHPDAGKPIFDARQMFEQALDADGQIQIDYGLLLYRPKENPTIVERAAKGAL